MKAVNPSTPAVTGPAREPDRVAVLLATHDGMPFLSEQLRTILDQVACRVEVWVSDDDSRDGTWEWLCGQTRLDGRIHVLARDARHGSASRNFYRLIRDVDASNFDFLAFADQDDIWFGDKLAYCIGRLRSHGAAAISSNVIALWPDGSKQLIRKSQRPRRMDFLFESAGQGCTYLIASDCARQFRDFALAHRAAVEQVVFHDWLLYAWCRANGFAWHIDPRPTLFYRQHERNVHGANSGRGALLRRIRQVRSGWYRAEVLKIARLVRAGPGFTPECAATIGLLEAPGLAASLRFMARIPALRRRAADRMLLLIACVCGWL
jgi:rhamnosyltransferase